MVVEQRDESRVIVNKEDLEFLMSYCTGKSEYGRVLADRVRNSCAGLWDADYTKLKQDAKRFRFVESVARRDWDEYTKESSYTVDFAYDDYGDLASCIDVYLEVREGSYGGDWS